MSRLQLSLVACALTACDAPPTPTEPLAQRLEPVTSTTLHGSAGTATDPVPVVRVVNSSDRPVSGVTVLFTVDGGGTIEQDRVQTASDGNASPGSWTLGTTPGVHVLTATLAAGVKQVAFTAHVAAGPLAAVVMASGDDQAGRAGEPLPARLMIRATDEFGNGVADIPVTFEVIEGGGTIAGGVTATGSDGHATSGTWTLGAFGWPQAVRARAAGFELTFTAMVLADEAEATLTWIDRGRLQEISPAVGVSRTLRGSGMEQARELAWSPDGKRLAYEWPEAGWYAVYLASLESWQPRRLAARHSRPAWSPDGRRLAVATGDCVYTCDLYTMTPDPDAPDPRLLMNQGYFPAWSPDGSRMAYVRMSGDDGYHALHVMNADGSGDHEIVPVSGPAFDHPSFSPDGKSIAFAICLVICRLHVVGVDGFGLRQLLPEDNMHSPAWSPDGRWIAFAWIRDRVSHIAYVSPQGGAPVLVGQGKSPAWRPRR
jgi:hypothetical protein